MMYEVEKLFEQISKIEPNENLLNLLNKTGKELFLAYLLQDRRDSSLMPEKELIRRIMLSWSEIYYSQFGNKIKLIDSKDKALEFWKSNIPYNRYGASSIIKLLGEDNVKYIYRLCEFPNLNYKPIDMVKIINHQCNARGGKYNE